jgi:hypothetical protein
MNNVLVLWIIYRGICQDLQTVCEETQQIRKDQDNLRQLSALLHTGPVNPSDTTNAEKLLFPAQDTAKICHMLSLRIKAEF